MKSFSIILLLAAFAVGVYCNNATYGNVSNYNAILSTEQVTSYPINGQFISRDVVFPKSGQLNNRLISGIRVTDHFLNNTGATSTLWSGGPGYTFTTLNLKSQLSRGINSTVQIYGN